MTSPELQQQWSNQTGVQCSTRTVHGWLLDHGLRSYKAVKKPLINERRRLARRHRAQAHRNWTARDRKKILWSDESSFQLYLPPANVRVLRRPGKALSQACTVPNVKHGGAVSWFGDAWVLLVLVISLSVMAHWTLPSIVPFSKPTCSHLHVHCSVKVKTGYFNKIMPLATHSGPVELGCRSTVSRS